MLPIPLDKGKMSKHSHLTGELGTMDMIEGRGVGERGEGEESMVSKSHFILSVGSFYRFSAVVLSKRHVFV